MPGETATFASREQALAELERAQRAEGLGDRRPHEHRGERLLDLPLPGPGLGEPVDQRVAPRLVLVARPPVTQSCGPRSATIAPIWIGVGMP